MDKDRSVKQGVVTAVFPSKNFGFISTEEGVEYFFHETATKCFEKLMAGSKVRFTPVESAKGHRAVGVMEDE